MWWKLCGVKFPLEFGVIQGRLGGFATIASFPKAFRKNSLPSYVNRSKICVIIYTKCKQKIRIKMKKYYKKRNIYNK